MAFKVGSYVLVRNFGLGILSSFSGDKFVNVNFGKSERCFLYEPNGNDYLSEVPDRFVKLINDEIKKLILSLNIEVIISLFNKKSIFIFTFNY